MAAIPQNTAMEQMNMTGLERVKIDFDAANIPASVKEFQPALYKDGDSYCCLLGSDPQAGVFGCGSTTEAALADWDMHLRERIREPKDGDPLEKGIFANGRF